MVQIGVFFGRKHGERMLARLGRGEGLTAFSTAVSSAGSRANGSVASVGVPSAACKYSPKDAGSSPHPHPRPHPAAAPALALALALALTLLPARFDSRLCACRTAQQPHHRRAQVQQAARVATPPPRTQPALYASSARDSPGEGQG